MTAEQTPGIRDRGRRRALVLLQLLRDEGSIRLKQAADALGAAPTTVHRLLAMLIYRGFAAQDESKRYVTLGAGDVGSTRDVRDVSLYRVKITGA